MDTSAKVAKVYQLVRLGRTSEDREEVICSGGKASIQRLVAALAEQGGEDRFRLREFENYQLNF